jgi:PAS domain S-box-containing protein
MNRRNLLKILFIDELLSDVEQAVQELRRENIKFEHITVCSGEDLVKAINEFKPDLIISDYIMPAFNGLQALNITKELNPDIPFILFTGSVSEEIVVDCIKGGARNFVMKEHLTRLPFAVKEAMEQVLTRQEMKATDLLLKESEEKLQSIFRSAPVGIGLLVNDKIIEINDSFCEMTGYSRRDLIGTYGELLFPSAEESGLKWGELRQQIAESISSTLEIKLRCRSGNIMDIILNISPLDKNDLTKGFTFSALDITKRKRAEEALSETEERFRNLYNDAVIGLYRTNSRGEILLANRTLVKMLGFQSFEELALRNLNESGYGPEYKRQTFIDKIERDGEVKDMEAVWISSDGREIFLRENAKAIYDSEGKILFYDGTVQDITEQRRVTEALSKMRNLFETLARVSPVGIFRTDADGYTTYVNPKWSELSGLSAEEAYGNGWLNAVHPEDRGKLAETWQNDIYARKESNTEYRFLKPDNSIIWVLGKAVPEVTDNEVAGYIGTITDITERKRVEDALIESELKYRQLVSRSPDGIFIVDISGKFLSVNKAICEGLRYSEEELLSMKIWDVVPEKFHTVQKQRLEIIFKGESPATDAEYEVKGKDGSVHYIEILTVPYFKGKDIIGFQGIARDITGRKKAEDILRNSEERLKILFDYAPDAYYLSDLKGTFVDGNIACEKLLGFNKDELIGKNFLKLNLLSISQLAKAAKLLVKNALGKGTGPDEFILIRKNGTKTIVEIITHPVIIKGKTLVMGIARDISERKNTENAIRESEEKYRMIFENVQDIYYETSIEGIILEVSPSIEIISKGQYTRDDLIGKSLYDFYPDPKELTALILKIKQKGTISDFEISLRNKDGSIVPCSLSSKICLDSRGRPEKIIGSMHDIADRKRASDALRIAKEKAEASDKLKTAFLNNISHEVRTPLNGILGFAEIISLQDLSEDDKKDALSMLHESSNRLLNTINNYMDISLITSGNLSVHKKNFLPAQVFARIHNNFKIKCVKKNLDLILQIPEQPEKLYVESDPEIFQKIINHLLDNAIKFTEKGSITLGYTMDGEKIVFFVKDTGVGIVRESLGVVFDNFTKEDQGPLKLTEGSGLGLSIAKGMIELLGGKIMVESVFGEGSVFSFTLPLAFVKEIKSTISDAPGAELNKLSKESFILVAEDDDTNFIYLNSLLERVTDATILHATNGREAIEIFKANKAIKLVLMDLKMPDIDGFEATRQIKLINGVIPVIAITAYAMSGDAERVLSVGCDGYLSKPINRKSLQDKLSEFIKLN